MELWMSNFAWHRHWCKICGFVAGLVGKLYGLNSWADQGVGHCTLTIGWQGWWAIVGASDSVQYQGNWLLTWSRKMHTQELVGQQQLGSSCTSCGHVAVAYHDSCNHGALTDHGQVACQSFFYFFSNHSIHRFEPMTSQGKRRDLFTKLSLLICLSVIGWFSLTFEFVNCSLGLYLYWLLYRSWSLLVKTLSLCKLSSVVNK